MISITQALYQHFFVKKELSAGNEAQFPPTDGIGAAPMLATPKSTLSNKVVTELAIYAFAILAVTGAQAVIPSGLVGKTFAFTAKFIPNFVATTTNALLSTSYKARAVAVTLLAAPRVLMCAFSHRMPKPPHAGGSHRVSTPENRFDEKERAELTKEQITEINNRLSASTMKYSITKNGEIFDDSSMEVTSFDASVYFGILENAGLIKGETEVRDSTELRNAFDATLRKIHRVDFIGRNK